VPWTIIKVRPMIKLLKIFLKLYNNLIIKWERNISRFSRHYSGVGVRVGKKYGNISPVLLGENLSI